MTSVGDPLVGQLLDGRYQITHRLARGGMATVYVATDIRLTRTVAVKVMHIGLGDDAEFARKFDREARSAAKLSHPNVVSVFDQGHDDGRPYIVMEYVEGRTLRDILNHEAPLPPDRALEIIEPVLGALAAAHEGGLVHRDVKPENVLLSDRGQIKVVDFGLAKAISAQTSTATQGLLIGTVSYLPPELVLSGRAGSALGRLQRRRGAVRDADRAQTARRRHPDPGRVRARPQRRAAAVAVPHRQSHPALPGRPGHRSDRPQPRCSAARRQGVPVPGPPGARGAARGSERRPRADPGPQRAAAFRPVGRDASRRRLRTPRSPSWCRRPGAVAGRSAPDRPPARPHPDLTADLPRCAAAHRARPRDGRRGPQPGVLRRRASVWPPGGSARVLVAGGAG